jgi:hypothetical protein
MIPRVTAVCSDKSIFKLNYPKVAFTSFVPVTNTSALPDYLCQYDTVNETHQNSQTGKATTNTEKRETQAPDEPTTPPIQEVAPIFDTPAQELNKT